MVVVLIHDRRLTQLFHGTYPYTLKINLSVYCGHRIFQEIINNLRTTHVLQ